MLLYLERMLESNLLSYLSCLINLFYAIFFHETTMPAHNNITIYYGEIEWLKSIIACFAFVIW
jgi:hypothetical protein